MLYWLLVKMRCANMEVQELQAQILRSFCLLPLSSLTFSHHEGRKVEIILFPPILQENVEVWNERFSFAMQVFSVHLCKKRNISEVDCGFLCLLNHTGKAGTLLPFPQMVDRLPEVAFGHWLLLTVLFVTSNSQKAPYSFCLSALFSFILSPSQYLLSLPYPLPEKVLTSSISRYFGISGQKNLFHLLLSHVIANCRNTHRCLLL